MPRLKTKKSAFVILFAVILVSIVLTISLSLYNITFKQLVLSSVTKEAQLAFFVADAGRRCALHYSDFSHLPPGERPFGKYYWSVDGDGNPALAYDVPDTGEKIRCEGNIDITVTEDISNPVKRFDFIWYFPIDGRIACARVKVEEDPSDSGKVTVTSRGFNNALSGSQCPTNGNGRNVEKALQTVIDGF